MFKRAEKKQAKYAIIIGENEINNDKVVIKDLNKQEQIEVPTLEVVDFFDKLGGIAD